MASPYGLDHERWTLITNYGMESRIFQGGENGMKRNWPEKNASQFIVWRVEFFQGEENGRKRNWLEKNECVEMGRKLNSRHKSLKHRS